MTSPRKFEIALSFAGEDRAYVEMVADQLRARGVSVFYDRYEETDLWGKDLYTHLVDVYMKQAQYTLMFISAHYLQKLWTNHERRAAQARAFEEAREYILPARFDDTEIPGILPTTGFIDLRRRAPIDVALMVCEKLGKAASSQKANFLPSPKSPALSSEVAFNFRSHDGLFRIGAEMAEFETKWSSASGNSIHCYNDPPTLRGVALAPAAKTVGEIGDASRLDWTSRTRTPSVGQFVVLQNTKGFYAALQILGINYENELRFKYWILPDGASDFSTVGDP
jgi:hypothetical protein